MKDYLGHTVMVTVGAVSIVCVLLLASVQCAAYDAQIRTACIERGGTPISVTGGGGSGISCIGQRGTP